jgi:hypothetical protein
MNSDDKSEGSERAAASAVQQGLESAVDTARQQAIDSIKPAAERVQSFADRQKVLGAEQIGGVARAVHGAAREFESDLPLVARSVHEAAARLEGAATSLREQSAAELVSAFNRFARAQPAALFGAAVLAGFAASRFLKSSSEKQDSMQPETTT